MTDSQPDLTISLFGADALFTQLGALTREIAGVRQGEDIEYVHRMRVATRRLRTRLQIFAPWLPTKKGDTWRKQIRRITSALGKARDTDVQFHFVQQFLDHLPDPHDRPGIERLLLRLKQRRTHVQQQVVKALDKLEESRTLEDIAQTLRQLRVLRHLQNVPPRSPALYEVAYKAISKNLAEMLSYEPFIDHPEDAGELHAMRIATKRLRYAMETFAALYPNSLKKYLQATKTIQDLLGDFHDGIVWEQELTEFLKKEERRAQKYFGHTRGVHRLRIGIEALMADRRHFREGRYKEFITFWEGSLKDSLWQELLKAVQPQDGGSEGS